MDIFSLYVDQRMSIPEISTITGIPRSNIRYALKKASLLRTRGDGVRLAASKGKLGSGLRGKTRVITDQWRKNISSAQVKAWAGRAVGFSLKPSGYIEYTMGQHKGRRAHVVIMESSIGRRLYANEVVHHIDHNKTNNELHNLKLMTRAEHAALHANTRERNKNGQLK